MTTHLIIIVIICLAVANKRKATCYTIAELFDGSIQKNEWSSIVLQKSANPPRAHLYMCLCEPVIVDWIRRPWTTRKDREIRLKNMHSLLDFFLVRYILTEDEG